MVTSGDGVSLAVPDLAWVHVLPFVADMRAIEPADRRRVSASVSVEGPSPDGPERPHMSVPEMGRSWVAAHACGTESITSPTAAGPTDCRRRQEFWGSARVYATSATAAQYPSEPHERVMRMLSGPIVPADPAVLA